MYSVGFGKREGMLLKAYLGLQLVRTHLITVTGRGAQYPKKSHTEEQGLGGMNSRGKGFATSCSSCNINFKSCSLVD